MGKNAGKGYGRLTNILDEDFKGLVFGAEVIEVGRETEIEKGNRPGYVLIDMVNEYMNNGGFNKLETENNIEEIKHIKDFSKTERIFSKIDILDEKIEDDNK